MALLYLSKEAHDVILSASRAFGFTASLHSSRRGLLWAVRGNEMPLGP